ncbi:MAG: hypothetical protein Ct9H300mP26_4790 [Acidimicrobiales bacterium]|nr:MAG: hypothetical protein Ct9H300mP26_4790 [Acidimicrobiales bacterium]
MEFRRISNLPPYVFTIIDSLKVERRRDGADVIDLGFGNPDIPSPATAVTKLSEAAENDRNQGIRPVGVYPSFEKRLQICISANGVFHWIRKAK